jgi:hypothetical protein
MHVSLLTCPHLGERREKERERQTDRGREGEHTVVLLYMYTSSTLVYILSRLSIIESHIVIDMDISIECLLLHVLNEELGDIIP